MSKWKVTLTLEEPFTCSSSPVVSNEIYTVDYIPATVIRGALFAALTREGRSSAVDTWLGVQNQSGMRYSPAWPMVDNRQTVPMPLSFVNDKGDVGIGGTLGALNVLWFEDQRLPDSEGDHHFQWTRPGHRWLVVNAEGEPDSGLSLATDSHMHVGLHYERQASRKGALFSRTVIPAGAKFVFLVEDPGGKLQDFPSRLFLGKRRSTGNGAASVDIQGAQRPAFPKHEAAKNEFLVHFLSDCLIASEAGGWQVGLDAKSWERLLGAPVERVFARSTHRQVFGWSNCWGRPREPVTAIAAGSCFRIRTKEDSAKFDLWEDSGLGARTEEGFGWIAVNPIWLFAGQDQAAFGRSDEGKLPKIKGQGPLTWPGLERVAPKDVRQLVATAKEIKSEPHARKLAELASFATRSREVTAVKQYLANLATRQHPRDWDVVQKLVEPALRLSDISELRFVLSSAATLSRNLEDAV